MITLNTKEVKKIIHVLERYLDLENNANEEYLKEMIKEPDIHILRDKLSKNALEEIDRYMKKKIQQKSTEPIIEAIKILLGEN